MTTVAINSCYWRGHTDGDVDMRGHTLLSATRSSPYYGIIPAFMTCKFSGFNQNCVSDCTNYHNANFYTKTVWHITLDGTWIIPFQSESPNTYGDGYIAYRLFINNAVDIYNGASGCPTYVTNSVYIYLYKYPDGNYALSVTVQPTSGENNIYQLFSSDTRCKIASYTRTASQMYTNLNANVTLHNDGSSTATCYAATCLVQYESSSGMQGKMFLKNINGTFGNGDSLYTVDDIKVATLTSSLTDSASIDTSVNSIIFSNALTWCTGEYYNYPLKKWGYGGSAYAVGAMPACFLAEGDHKGQMMFEYNGNTYYACFNSSTGKWSANITI